MIYRFRYKRRAAPPISRRAAAGNGEDQAKRGRVGEELM